jgi:type I restriction enzyme R subunit
VSPQTNEHAFESYIESTLLEKSGWAQGDTNEWDVELALFPQQVIGFIQDTQPELWQQMRELHGDGLEGMIIPALARELDLKGSLHVLRHGFKFYGKTFELACFKPAHGLNPEVLDKYAANRLTVTRQVPCHPGAGSTADMVFAVNGVPVATCELKNPATGQSWRHAVRQYQRDRDPGAPLFRFKARSLVHFAVDPDEVHMCTRLSKHKSRFLPFNRGSDPGQIQCGKGNPRHPSGHRSGYLWEDVLARDSFLDILGHFMFVETKDEKIIDAEGRARRRKTETLIFPRFHQLNAVRRLVERTRTQGVGHNFLVQHSAGSGKTNSISWLSHRLASLHTQEDQKIFDCVLVITDRRVLDQQLQDAVYQIEHVQGVVKAIDQDSRQLAEALVDGTKIVITTLQKFPFVLRGLLRVAGAETADEAGEEERRQAREWEAAIAQRRYAVIVDEAHSSQTGETAREFKAILGVPVNEDAEQAEDWEDRLNQVMASRGQQPNLSFYAFTATPKARTLEVFGTPGPSGHHEAFHIYSMRQAIEEGFILDVLSHYTTYATYYRLLKAAEDDPSVPRRRAARALARYMSLHPHNIEQKTAVMVEHFRHNVRHRLGGRAKAMVVTQSRLHAVRYFQAFRRYHCRAQLRGCAAPGGLLGHRARPGHRRRVHRARPQPRRGERPAHQRGPPARALRHAGLQPAAGGQQVPDRLRPAQAAHHVRGQAPRRRAGRADTLAPEPHDPGKDAPFVLDFVNDADEHLPPPSSPTTIRHRARGRPRIPTMLDALKHALDQAQVYHWSEVEAFAQDLLQARRSGRAPADHAHMQSHLQPAVDRFKGIEDDEARTEFRAKLSAYVKLYAFLSQVLPYTDPELEMLYSFGRFLLPHLPLDRDIEPVKLTDEVALQYYRLERIHAGGLDLGVGEPQKVYGPAEVGTGKAMDEKAPLSEIINLLNERFGTDFDDEDRLFFEQIKEKACKDEEIIETALANPFDNFALGIRQLIERLMIQRMSDNDAIVTRYMDDKAFKETAFPVLAREIYEAVREVGDSATAVERPGP